MMVRKKNLSKLLSGWSDKPLLWWCIALLLLTLATLATTWQAASYLSSSSDDLVYPYLFQHPQSHDLLLPGDHSNILKFPLFWVQSLLPYNYQTFMLITVGLTVLAVLLWIYLLSFIRNRYESTILSLTLLTIILGSGLFVFEITGTTIRNIEYPIALLFIIVCAHLLRWRAAKKPRLNLAIYCLAFILYILTCAGDNFFLYTITPALLVGLVVQLKRTVDLSERRQILTTFLVVVCSAPISLIIPRALNKMGLIGLYTEPKFHPHVLPLNHLAPSFTTALTQLLNMSGADIFGKNIAPANSLIFFNFLLFVCGTLGLWLIVKHSVIRPVITKETEGWQILATRFAALAYFFVFIAYVFSDLVVTQQANGSIVNSGQARYLSLMPFLLGLGVVYLFRRFSRFYRLILPVSIVIILLLIGGSLSTIKQNLHYDMSFKQSQLAVAKVATEQHVQLLVSGYWFGASTKFWSRNHLDYVTVAGCNVPTPVFNNRVSWYTPGHAKRSAIIVSRTSPDAPFWQSCSNAQLEGTYGKPDRIINLQTFGSPSIWIYNRDLRSSLQPFVNTF